MLTVNQERIVKFFNQHPEVFPSDLPHYRELANLCAELRRIQKTTVTKELQARREEVYKRMDSVINLLGLSDDDS